MRKNLTGYIFASLLILTTIITPSIVKSQDLNVLLIKENIEKFTSNTEFIASDQINESTSSAIPEETKTEETNKFDFSMESSITPTSKYINIPLGFTIKKISFSCSIPYYIRRGMNYSHGTESVTGIGDLSIKALYKTNKEKFNSEFRICVKLPTGNENKQKDGYLVPLGTGSTDILGQAIFSYLSNRNLLSLNLTYRINGSVDRVAQITYPATDNIETISYNIKNGNTLMINTAYSYKVWKYAALVAGFSATMNEKGEIDREHSYSSGETNINQKGLNAGQNFTFVDANPSLVFLTNWFNLSIGCKLPIYTKYSAINTENERKTIYSIRLTCPIF